MTSLYEIVGEKFFTPLASKNRKVYLDTILFLHQLINELFENGENDKVKIVDSLTQHLDDSAYIEFFSDDGNYDVEITINNREKAQLLILKLEEYDWLIEESVGDGKKTLDFNPSAYSFISLIIEIIENRKPQYTSYIKTINNTLSNFNYTIIDDLEIVDKTLIDFVFALRGLRSDIQRYYKNITKNKNEKTLITLLEQFTGEYKEYFFDSAYLDLKIRDNVDACIPKIKMKLEQIFNDDINMQKLIQVQSKKQLQDKKNGIDCMVDAAANIEEIRKRIFININSIPSIIETIDSKNEKYVTRTVSVIIHLINRGEDITGILHRLIDYVKQNDKFDEKFFHFFEMKHYTFDALSKPRKYNPKPEPEMMPLDYTIDKEVTRKTVEMFKENKKYSIYGVNNFVLDFLKGYQSRKISELEIQSKHEFVMIVSILVYSKLPNALYELTLTSEKVIKNDVIFNNFVLREKGKGVN